MSDGHIYRTLGTLCGNCKETQLREFHRILLTVSRKRNLGF